ncbi:hypothetical protein ACQ5SO_08170 [Rhodovulum sp. DZ06]|uniref:hypothetical protein n=1 Tax=Rhodovulum sp. DZ06 TaxID=3425126 RepID=UPI003D3288EB
MHAPSPIRSPIRAALLPLGLALGLGACAAPLGTAPLPDRPVDDGFTLSEHGVPGTDLRMQYWSRAAEHEGRLAVCSAVAVHLAHAPYARETAQRMIAGARAVIEGETALRGMGGRVTAVYDRSLPRPKTATCVATELPWRWDAAPEVVVKPPRSVSLGKRGFEGAPILLP